MAEVNGTDHLVRHEKETKLNGYDNEGYHCQERSEDEEESANDDDRLRVVVTENGHRPEDDSHMSNGYVHEETNGHSTTVNGSAVIVIEENKSDSNMNDSKEDCSQKPLDTRLHHFVPVDDIDRKILNGSDGTHVTIPEDAVINFTTGRVKVRKGSSNNSQVSNERESIPLETILPSYEAEDKIGLGEKAELEAELTNHKNGLWSEGHNSYSNTESPYGNSEKLNGTSKSSDEISLPVNNHRKCLSSDVSDTSSEQKSTGEKLYFTEENRKLCPGWRRVFVCGLILIIIAVALLLGVLAATGILLAESSSKNSRYESGHSQPSSFISQAGHSFRPRPSSKVPQNFLPSVPEGADTTIDPVSRTSSPAVSSKVPVLNDTSHSQTIVPNALVGEFTIDEIFTDDLKDNSSNGYQSLAKFIEKELHGIFKRNGGVFEAMKILSFSPGSIKIKFVTIWASDRNVILSTKAEEVFKSYLKKNRNSLLAYPVDLESIRFIDVFDECRVQKGGCAFSCVWDYNTLLKTCICEKNMILLADGKSCGPKPATGAFEITTPKFINHTKPSDISTTTNNYSYIKEPVDTTAEQDKTTPSTIAIPTIVTKAIISITELFHNITSTESPAHVTNYTVNLSDFSAITKYLSSDIQTTTESYIPKELTTIEKSTSTILNPGTEDQTIISISATPNSKSTENGSILKESDATDVDINSYPLSTTSTSISDHKMTTVLPLTNPNSPVDLLTQPTITSDGNYSDTETAANLSPTDPPTTNKDLFTIGYHIKEETTEMYTLKDNTELTTTSESDSTVVKPTLSSTDFKETNNEFILNNVTEFFTTEVSQEPEITATKNTLEVMEFNSTDMYDNPLTETTIIMEDLETTKIDFEEPNITDATDYVNITESSDRETQNENKTNFTLSNDTLNETSYKTETEPFITTTSGPIILSSHSNRSPEVRSFDENYENETTTENISLHSTDNSSNDSILETNNHLNENETLTILNSFTTSLSASETLNESITEEPVILETTHFVPNDNKYVTSTDNKLIETTIAPNNFSEQDMETTTNTELVPTLTTENPLNNINTDIMDGDISTVFKVFENEATTIPPTEIETEATTVLSTETKIEIMDTSNNTELDATISENNTEINTNLPSTINLENGTEYSSDNLETTSNLHNTETTITSYNETIEENITEIALLNIENVNLTTITDSSEDEKITNSSEALNNTDNTFPLVTTLEPMNITNELTTLEVATVSEDSHLTSPENNILFNSNTAILTSVTPTLSLDSNETLMLTAVQNYTTSTAPYNDTEETTEYVYDTEMYTLTNSDNETVYPFDMDSNITMTDMPFENSFLDLNSTLMVGGNESLENSTFLDEYGNFTTESYDVTNETTTNASTGVECREDQFLCEPLSRCINDTFLCDGIQDCPDGRDEFECKDSCHSNFMCPNSTTCIMSEARCDGIWDCENGTDEDNCAPSECAQHEVMCLDHSRCIKPGHICDWKYNCLDRSDEVGCIERTTCESSGRFFCNDGLCIPWSLKCDGEHDCKEGEDEGNCTCLSDEFQCTDGKCLKSSSRCDGHQDCHDADDEMGCVTVDSQHIVSTYEPYSGTWGLLCAEDWNLDDGQNLCQELGFGHALNVERVHVSFNGTWMAMRRENLTESSLWTERVSFAESCTSGLAAAVECQKFVCGEYSGLLHRRRRRRRRREVVSSSSTQWPFIGYTSTFQSNKGCLSEILTPIWLITSAECLLSISKEPFNGSDWYVRTNIGRDIEADLAQNHEVLKIINHPHSSKFRSLTLRDYDVALIRLKHGLVFVSDKIGAICLPEEQVPPGITCFSGVLGTERPRAPPPAVLTMNSLALQIIDRKNCNRVEHFNNTINRRMLCTQSSEGHTICDNDEGTPLMCLTGINQWSLAGMLTYQRFCDIYNKHPAVFSNLFTMRKFLDQVTGQKQYEVSYDSNMYIIIPPTTPSPTMPETTTPEVVTLSTTEIPFTYTTYPTTSVFENETEIILDNLENVNETTEITEELAREENYTTVLPEELVGLMGNTTVDEDYWNVTVTTPHQIDTIVLNTTVEELEKLEDKVSANKTHDNMFSLLNDEDSNDDIANSTSTSDINIEFDNVTVSPELQATALGELTNIPTPLELNDSLSTTTEFTTSDNETNGTTDTTFIVTKTITNSTNITTDAAIITHLSMFSSENVSEDYSKLTTSNVYGTTLDLIPAFNDTIEILKPTLEIYNESKVVSQPLIALMDNSEELDNRTIIPNLEALENNAENIEATTTLNEPYNPETHNLNIDSETTVDSTTNTIDFNGNTIAEATTQPALNEDEAITIVVEGEPDADLAFSVFKNPDGLKIESYRMLEDNNITNISEESTTLLMKDDSNFSFTTENEASLISTVTTTLSPDYLSNETEKHDLQFENVTNSFILKPIHSTSDNKNNSMSLSSEIEEKSSNAILLPTNLTEKHDIMFENLEDEIIPKSEDLVNSNSSYSISLPYESNSTFDVINKSSLSVSNETEMHDLISYNVTEKTVPKLAGPIVDDINYSVPLVYEDDSKSKFVNKTSLLFSNEDETTDSIFLNETNKSLSRLTKPFTDNVNYSEPFTFEDNSKIGAENTSLASNSFIEKSNLESNNVTDELMPKSIDSIIDHTNYSYPLTDIENPEIEIINASTLLSDNFTKSRNLEFDSKEEEFVPTPETRIMDDETTSTPQTFESETINTSLPSDSYNITKNEDSEFDSKTDASVLTSEVPIINDTNHLSLLTPEIGEKNASSLLHFPTVTEAHDLEFDNESRDFIPKSESLITDVMNHSVPLTPIIDSTNVSSLIYPSNMDEDHDMVAENMTNRTIPKSVGPMNINFSIPLFFSENIKFDNVNESTIDYEDNKSTASILELGLDATPMEDSFMIMNITSDELNSLRDNNTSSNASNTSEELNGLRDNSTSSNTNDCGVWTKNFGTTNKSANQIPYELWPAIGYLQMTANDSKICPSTIVSSNYVVSSLSCLTFSNKDLDPEKWTYVGGFYDPVTLSGTRNLMVNKIIPYPGISVLLNEYDVALVKMNDTIDKNEYSKKACVTQNQSEPGKQCFTVGWNQNSSEGDLQSQFYSFPLTIISTEECNNTMNYNGVLIDGLICGIQEKENIESCYMELGSPLFCLNENKQWEIQGILNLPGPCDMTQPIVFSNILNVEKWINDTLTNDDKNHDANY